LKERWWNPNWWPIVSSAFLWSNGSNPFAEENKVYITIKLFGETPWKTWTNVNYNPFSNGARGFDFTYL
jgi:hypothetical protein